MSIGHKVLQFAKSRFFRWFVSIGGFVAILSLSGSIYDAWKRRDILYERQEELALIEAEVNRLKRELEESQSPEFIEREARNVLGMSKEGETVVLMESQKDSSGLPPQEQEVVVSKWKMWWRLFF